MKGPLQSRQVEQYIRTSVKADPVQLKAGSQATGSRPGFQYNYLVTKLRQTDGCAQATHTRTDHDDLFHFGGCSPRISCAARRQKRKTKPSRPSGGKAFLSIAGTNSAPRLLAST